MSFQGQALLIYTLLILFCPWWYFVFRTRLTRGAKYQIPFFLNSLYVITLIFLLPFIAFREFNVNNGALNFCLILMAVASLMHHLSLIAISRSNKPRSILEKVHGPISHLFVGSTFALGGVLAMLSFYPEMTTGIDQTILLTWFLIVEAVAIFMFICSLKIVKW